MLNGCVGRPDGSTYDDGLLVTSILASSYVAGDHCCFTNKYCFFASRCGAEVVPGEWPHSGRGQSAELHSLPKVPIFFKSFELLDGNVPIFSHREKKQSILASSLPHTHHHYHHHHHHHRNHHV